MVQKKDEANKLVYSTDPKDQERLKDKKTVSLNQYVNLASLVVNFRIEKGGRGGKVVTVLGDLPQNEDFLASLVKELKTKCGTGGTFKILEKLAQIELQGDKREAVKKILQQKNIKFKGQ